MDRQNAAARTRRGWMGMSLLLLGVLAAPSAMAACNLKPKIDPDSQTVPETTGGAPTTVTLNGSGSTPKGQIASYAWTYVGSTPASLPVTLTNANQSIASFKAPSVAASGGSLTFRLSLVCDDGTRGSIDTTVNVTDVVVNQPPVASATVSPGNPTENQVVTLDGTSSFDPDGTALTYSWTQIGGLPNVTLSPIGNGSKATFVAPDVSNTNGALLTFRLTVSDGSLTGFTDKVVNVLWTNNPPVARLDCPVGGIINVNEGGAVSIDGSTSSDSDGTLTYSWSQYAGLPNLGIGSVVTPKLSFTAPHLGYQQLGGISLRLTVTDNNGAASTADCSVFIHDVTAPVLSLPSDITAEATSAAGKAVSYTATAQDAVDDASPFPASCAPASGSTFGLAAAPTKSKTTPVTCSATDSAGNPASGSFNVTVQDTSPPVITAPGGLGLEATSAAGAVATFSATTLDAVDGAGTATCAPASGSTFALGATSVSCNATDARGNAATAATFTVNVFDTTAPTIDAMDDIGPLEATSAAGAVATYASPATHDAVDGTGTATCAPPSGSTFALGSTTVTCNASDAAHNTATAVTFHVAVRDNTPPTIDATSDIDHVEATGPSGAPVSFTVPATHDVVDGDGIATCDANSGDTFPLGTTTVHCDATDHAGNHAAQASFTVTVVDTTAPTIATHADLTIEATGPTGALVDYGSIATSDLVDGAGTATCTPATNTTFALGNATVTCHATDAHGNAAEDTTFKVTVRDTTPPTIDTPADIDHVEATGPGGASVNFIRPATYDLVDGDGQATCDAQSGDTFALGTTTVHCDATDAHGNHATRVGFTITVVDTTPPTIAAHDDVGPEEATSAGGAYVDYATPATTDIVDGAGTASCAPASGSQFKLGETTVDCNATDAHGNHAAPTSFKITVHDSTPPAIAAHGDETVEATGPLGALVTYSAPATTDAVDGAGLASCAQASGTQFALGTTQVTCNAVDVAGNTSTPTHFDVIVRDTTPPDIDAHASIAGIEATGPGGAPVSYIAPATLDIVDGAGSATCLPASGATFALGTTTVHCNAKDAAGNAATETTFDVSVVDTTPPLIAPHGDVGPVEATGPSGASVGYVAPGTTDVVDGPGNASCAPASGTTFGLGDTQVTCNASDAHHNAAAATGFKVKVRDTTPPVIAAHANVTAEATGLSGAVVSYTRPGWTDVVSGTGLAACLPASGSTFAFGSTTVTCNASDGVGNAATPTTFQVIVRDTTAPVLTYHGDVTATATGSSSAKVTYTSPTASDVVDGNVAVTCTPASGSSFNVGGTTVNCAATDAHGNTGHGLFKVTVSYAFAGFFRPVDNLPVVNVVKAGSAVPVKFSLGGDQGLAIFAANSPATAPMACSGAVQDAVEETVTAGGSSLSYDATAGQYIYVWKTDKAWGGTCRQLQVKFADGSVQVANFNFSR